MRKFVIALAVLAVPAAALAASSFSISIKAKPLTVVYGTPTMLSGVVSNGQAGQNLTIGNHLCSQSSSNFRMQSKMTTRTGGKWARQVQPALRTSYNAKVGTTVSPSVTVNVQPKVVLSQVASGKFRVRVYLARTLEGKVGIFQRWSSSAKRWYKVQSVTLKEIAHATIPTVVSGASWSARVKPNRTVRFALSTKQVAPCYAGNHSNTIVSS